MRKLLITCVWLSLSLACMAGVMATLPDGREIKLYDNMYALVIGNSDYCGGWSKLPNALTDAREVSAKLSNMGFQITEAFNLNSVAMNKAISDFVYQQGREEDAALLIYYAGHGDTEQTADGEKLGYIIPIDTPLRHQNPQLFSERGISMTKIQEYALKIQSRHVLMLFDSCFSGSIFALSRDPLPPAITEKVASKVRQFITSGNENETVPDKSYFKTCFLQGLEGDADLNRDGYVTGVEIGNYLSDQVVNYTRSSQHPQYGKIRNPNLDKGDFVFALGQAATGTAVQYGQQGGSYSAETSTGSVVIKTSVAGNIYIDDKLICPVSIGETKSIRNITAGLTTIELRSPQGDQSQRVNILANQSLTVSFIVDLSHKGLIYVEGGSFQMGDVSGTHHKDERPLHKVNLSPFYIAKYEVTQQLFREVMGYNTSFYIDPQAPVEMVSWYEAIKFCNKLSQKEGLQPVYTIDTNRKDPNNYQKDDDLKWTVSYDQFALGYRLPTEAEWEFAARGGIYSKGYEYAGSNDPKTYAWYMGHDSWTYSTVEVGKYYPNELGLYDMSGNVYEWCWDWFGDYSAMDQNNPSGPRAGHFRIVRGGSYYSITSRIRISQRGYDKPNRYYNVIGLRLVRSSGGF